MSKRRAMRLDQSSPGSFGYSPASPACRFLRRPASRPRTYNASPKANPLPELITDDALSRFAVIGSPSRCRDAIAGIVDAGITHPVLGVARIDEPKEDAERRVIEAVVSHFL